jgi:hypothetical protein
VRKVIASEMVTLDGYFAGPKGEIDWFFWSEEMTKSAIELIGTVDTILFGRVTYEGMASYWPTEAALTENPTITDSMNNLPKIVFSKTLQKAEWKNTQIIRELCHRNPKTEKPARQEHGDLRQRLPCIRTDEPWTNRRILPAGQPINFGRRQTYVPKPKRRTRIETC